MTSTERKYALDYLHGTRQRMLEMVERLSLEQLQYKPAPDRWSVAECVEHVIVVESRAITRIADALQQPADPSKCSTCDDDESLVRGVATRTKRVQAPEPARPTGRWEGRQLPAQFRAARERSLEFAAKVDSDLRRYVLAHPVFGEIDCYQWLLLIPVHGERHRLQSQEVISDPGFPAA